MAAVSEAEQFLLSAPEHHADDGIRIELARKIRDSICGPTGFHRIDGWDGCFAVNGQSTGYG